jgi:hypothetical protein
MAIEQEIRKIAKHYGVKFRVMNLTNGIGGTYANNTIFLSTDPRRKETWKSKANMFSAFFHELGHHYCTINDKFVFYHQAQFARHKTKRDRKKWVCKILKTANRAELYVDKWAEKEFSKWYPNLKYRQAYRTKTDKQWLKEYYLDYVNA